MKTPYDDDIAAMEKMQPSYQQQHALNGLYFKRQGWLDAHEVLLPLLRGMLDIESLYEGKLEFQITDAHKALIKQVEEVVK
jgi:hypothetical protein